MLQTLQSSGFECWELGGRDGCDMVVEVHRWLLLGLASCVGGCKAIT